MDDELKTRLIDRLDIDTGHSAALGLRVVFVEEGAASMAAPWRPELVGDPDTDVIAGGVVTSLLDHCSGLAVTTLPTGYPCATLDLRIDYMRPAAPRATVTAEARCYKLTRSIAFVRAEAWDLDRNDLIATAQSAFSLNPPTKARPQ